MVRDVISDQPRSHSLPQILSFAALAAALFAAACGGGCQSYHSRPLDLPAHAESWHARRAADAAIQRFAERPDPGDVPGERRVFDPADGLSLEEAETVALVFNPDLRLARLHAGVARALADHAGLWEDPVFQVDILHILESVSKPWIFSPGIALTLPLSGRLNIEWERAAASLRAELLRVAEAEWTVQRELRETWAAWTALQLKVDETERLIDTLHRLVEATSMLVDAGEMLRTQAALFAIERGQRLQDDRRIAAELVQVELQLKQIMGLSPDAAVELIPGIHGLAESVSPEDSWEAAALAARNPTLLRMGTEYQAAEESLREQIARQYPDLVIGPAYESDQGQSRIGLLGGISLPVFNRNRRGIAEAEAQRELARGSFEVAAERLLADLAATEAHLRSLRDQRQYVEQDLVPQIDRQIADARRLLELGEDDASGGLVLLESLRRAHELRLYLIDLRRDELLAEIRRRHLLGPPPGSPTSTHFPAAAQAAHEVHP
jgi:outer membrane protein, heavy metal efflux system